jgi:membrane associated rhomboid family serine protease
MLEWQNCVKADMLEQSRTYAGNLRRLVPVVGMVVLMWLATGINLLLLGGAWLRDGVRAHDPSGFFPNLLFAPFLHVGLPHLVANSVPFLVLGGLIALQSVWRFATVTLAAALGAAVVAWVLGSSGSVHVGASGLVFAYLAWLIVRAIRERSLVAILLGLFALALYGGILWGLSPFQTGVSWQGHFGGALAGVAAALMWPTPQRATLPSARPARYLA